MTVSSSAVRFVFPDHEPHGASKKRCLDRPGVTAAPGGSSATFEQRLDEIQTLFAEIRRLSNSDPLGNQTEIDQKLLSLNQAVAAMRSAAAGD